MGRVNFEVGISSASIYPIQNVYLQNARKGETGARGNPKCW